jgi:cell division protein FtsB
MALLRLLKTVFLAWRGVVSWTLLLAIVVVTWCVLQRNAIWEYLDTQEMRNKERMRVEKLEHEIEQLQSERNMLSSGGDEHELVARETYRLSKPGEEVLYLKMPSETKASADETSTSQKRIAPLLSPVVTPGSDSNSSPTSQTVPSALPTPERRRMKETLALPHALPSARPALPGQ